MIEQMSPLIRRIVAVGLFILLVLLALEYVVVPLAAAIREHRREWAALKTREVRFRATMSRTSPDISKVGIRQAVPAISPAQGLQQLQTTLAGYAAISGATLQPGSACNAGQPLLLCADMNVSGKEADVAHFLRLVEYGVPVIRFQRWRLAPEPTDDTQLHFIGRAIAVWKGGA